MSMILTTALTNRTSEVMVVTPSALTGLTALKTSTTPTLQSLPPVPLPPTISLLLLPSIPASSSSSVGGSVGGVGHEKHSQPDMSWFIVITTYFAFGILIIFGHLRDHFGRLMGCSRYVGGKFAPPRGYAPLLQDWENFFTRRMYHRVQDCWNRPIDGPPIASATRVIERVKNADGLRWIPKVATKVTTTTTASTASTTTTEAEAEGRNVDVGSVISGDTLVTRTCVNLGSYNYLGFSDDWSTTCRNDVLKSFERFPTSLCASFAEGGYLSLHRELEATVAEFVGKESSLIYNMGWATNALGLPALIGGKGSLIISDSLNHNSLVAGARSSGAVVRVFRHNDLDSLRALVRAAIADGQERTHRPWKKILICVEGIYSMEGEFCDLKSIVSIAKAHKCFLYLDEAHSIGATGPTGRGVCEASGVDPKDVDLLMGTFTKSFGAMGGYIAGSKELISWIRERSAGFLIDNAMAPCVAQQVLTAFKIIMGEDGTNIGAVKLSTLKSNANYFRQKLGDMGLQVLGDFNSPVIPLMIYNPTKMAAFSRECLKRDIAVVVVGFPATPLVKARARFCLSAGHTRQDLDKALAAIEEVVDLLWLRYQDTPYGRKK